MAVTRERVTVELIRGEYTAEVHKLGTLTATKKKSFTKEMEQFANNFLETNFDMSLNIPIEISGRMTRTGGMFYSRRVRATGQATPMYIRISERFVACALLDPEEGIKAILDVLKHELVHYALCEQREDYSDGSYAFESALARLEVGASGKTAKHKRLTKSKTVWYSFQDIYNVGGRELTNNHTKSSEQWMGTRVGYKIVKSYF